MSYLMAIQNDFKSEAEKRRFAKAIKSLRSCEDLSQYNLRKPRYNRLSSLPSQNNIGGPQQQQQQQQIPVIPERKSSSNEQLLEWMKSFSSSIPPQRPMSRRLVREDGAWKILNRRTAPPPQYPPNSTTGSVVEIPSQRIHVTVDSDTFHSLPVTGMHDPRLIKNAILRKLGLEGNIDKFYFFHENGKHSEPLTDSELSHICQISDHSSTNRILVKSADYAEQYRSYSKDGTNSCDFAVRGGGGGGGGVNGSGGYKRHIVHATRSHHYLGQFSDSPSCNDFDVTRSCSYYTKISPSFEDYSHDGYFERQHHNGLRRPSVDYPHQEYYYPCDRTPSPWTAGSRSHRSSTSSTDTTYPPDTNLWHVHQEPEIPPNQHQYYRASAPLQKADETLPTSQSLWAIPPQNIQKTTTPPPPLTSSVSLWAVAPSQRQAPTPSPSLWAIPPLQSESQYPLHQQEYQKEHEYHYSQKTLHQQFSSENLSLHPSVSGKIHRVSFSDPKTPRSPRSPRKPRTPKEGRPLSVPLKECMNTLSMTSSKSLHIDIPSELSEEMPITPISSSSLLVTSSSSEFDLTQWAERPTVENLYKDIDKYLPGHDLDKEIIVDPPAATCATATLEKRLQTVNLKKSIRVMANEGHRNMRNTVNIARPNDLFRRGSSKMWHQKVEQVKPGIGTSPSGEIPKTKQLHWVQGELIGKGSFGKVYHALNVEAGEWIAVKQVDLPIKKADFSNPQLCETRDALFREISLLEDLDNEYIVQYLGYDVDEEAGDGHINIFLEYVPGGSIASCLAKTGKFEDPLVRFFTRQILMGLAYLHNRNVLHRDIKAGNILLDQHGTCKITDFGLSKLSGQDKAYDPHSNNSVMRGTVFWMAPEVVKGTNYNAKVDIWSLGCTVIEMLTGDHPWLDLNMLAALYSLGKYQPPPLPQGLSEQARDFLSQCFIINPEDRPTAEELLSHPFVQKEDGFEFKKYMKQVEIERRASKKHL